MSLVSVASGADERSSSAQSLLNDPARSYQVRLGAELGFLGVLSHRIQFSQDGAEINYIQEGGQDVLFPFTRFTSEVHLKRHRVVLLYQPLDIRTQEIATRDLRIDGLVFPEGTSVNFRYGFPFWRASWMYDLAAREDREFALGLSLQIRNASIEFASDDGLLLRTNRDIGPVPILKARWRQDLSSGAWLGAEVDGFYAPIKYINGSDTDVVGAIVDASVRGGVVATYGTDLFLNLRYLGGGGSGTSEPDGPGDGYVNNWLHTFSLSIGATLR